MGWLRSRWTVVALVPAFFLAGFGIVSALGDDSDGSEPSAAPGSSPGGTAGPQITVIQGESEPAEPPGETDPAATSADGGGGGAGTATDGNGGGGNSGGGNAPPAPPPGVIAVDYGSWEGSFELENTEIVPEFGFGSVVGELTYVGGLECPVGLVRVRTWFYSPQGAVIGRTVWESVQSTGDGAEVTGREPLPFEAYGPISEEPASAALRFVAVECL
jgi:hypothetical protein